MEELIHRKKPARREKVIQFGGGGFLRGFFDWMLRKVDDASDFCGSTVVVCSTGSETRDLLRKQNCTYTHLVRGKEGTETTVVDVISRCLSATEEFAEYLSLADGEDFRFIVSNTTEAGIVFSADDKPTDAPPSTFPAKLTLLLKRRYDKGLPGFVFLPCELIDRNGDALRECLLRYAAHWGFGEAFASWIKTENVFCNTLVDRINTGYPKGETIDLGYEDALLNASETFYLWVIETEHDLFAELPFDKAGLNVIVTRNGLERYRTRKVRILNGAHTSLVPHALLSGFDTVKSCIDDGEMNAYLRRCIFDEIIPTLDLPKEELVDYAESVLGRFGNPFVKHYLSAISLNSVSKFRVRVLPSILEYRKRFGRLPENLCFAFARLIEFYRVGTPRDDATVTEFMQTHTVKEILQNEALWGEDLSFLSEKIEETYKC